MRILARHVSPDTELAFVVQEDDDGITLGFEGSTWHTHGDILDGGWNDPVDAALAFTEALISDRLLIAVSRLRSERYISIVFDPIDVVKNALPDEDIEFRVWSGALRCHGIEILEVDPTWHKSWPPEHALHDKRRERS